MKFLKGIAILGLIAANGSIFAADKIAEWDIQALTNESQKQGWTFKPRRSWVTEYLKDGGRIEDITGLREPTDWKTGAIFHDLGANKNLPSHFDWREESPAGLQPIRNQKNCGSCWAFSVTAVLESLIKINFPDESPDLAEQTLVSTCSSSGSCSGGYFSAFNYLKNPGLPSEEQDPYKAYNTRCKSGLEPVAKLVQWAYIGNGNKSASVEQLKTAIAEHGPISVTVNGSFGSYGEGIYNRCNTSGTNHMVNLEGWDDEGEYWIMRNSWGSSWGENGYMRIKWKGKSGYRCNNIGQVAAYAVLTEEGKAELARNFKLRNHLAR